MHAAPTNSRMGRDLRRMHGIGCGPASYSMLRTDSSCWGQKFWDANKVVSGGGEHEEPLHQAAAAMTGLAQAADGLDPAERLFDPLALDCADAIAGMAGGARIDRRA